jgi:hypothetical protein
MDETENNLAGKPSGTPPAPRPRVLDYFHDQRRLVRDWFTGENFRAFAKSMAWVVPLTILIWVYAEREQRIETKQALPIPIAVKTTVPNKYVSLVGSDHNIMAKLGGPRKGVDQVTNTLMSGSPQRVEIFIPEEMLRVRGRTTINVPTSWVANNPLFRSRDITVSECSPATVLVEVDDIEVRQLTVAAPPDASMLDGPPTFTPPTVQFQGPSEVLRKFDRSSDGKILVYADFSDRTLFHQVGTLTTALLPLKGPDSAVASLTPVTIKADFTLKQEDVPGTIRAMPVFILASPTMTDKYKVEFEASLANVAVTGPRDQIEKLGTDALSPAPRAILEILPDDKPGSSISRSPRFELPAGLKIAGAPVKISFQLTPRTPE